MARKFGSLLPAIGALILTRAENARSADPSSLAQLARAAAPDARVSVDGSIDGALRDAWRIAPRIVVAGSIFLLGDVLKHAAGLETDVIPFEHDRT